MNLYTPTVRRVKGIRHLVGYPIGHGGIQQTDPCVVTVMTINPLTVLLPFE